MKLIVNVDTTFKRSNAQASELPKDQKAAVVKGKSFIVDSLATEKGHYRVVLNPANLINNMNTWYVFMGHCSVDHEIKEAPNGEVLLDVPYFSQLDNKMYPYGSCNVTSIAMAMAYLGLSASGPDQLEDEIQMWVESNGLSRHSPQHLAEAVKGFGFKDTFVDNANFDEVKAWLRKGFPVVVHGYFTSSGHIVTLVGYNSKGFIVNDPYGEWYQWGYDRNDSSNPAKGKQVLYSYNMMTETCVDSIGMWAHFISA
jgi:uncharacterized protein YvpB